MVDPEFVDKIEDLEHIAIFGFDGIQHLNLQSSHFFSHSLFPTKAADF